jgi:very-short-patch-repair endonuclease
MADAVRHGAVSRVRRSWLVVAGCDPRRAAAASVGGRLTCVSAAAVRGWWVPEHDGVHVAVRPTSSRFDAAGLTVHWAPGPVRTPRTATEDPPVNVLFHIARCLPRREALPVWESAIHKRVVTVGVLKRVRWGSEHARTLAEVASVLSDSGIETVLVDGIRLAGLPVRQQVWVDGHPLDALVGDRLGIQVDGFEFHRAADRRRDLRADARLVLRGYTVLRFDYVQVLFGWDEVLTTVQLAVSQGLHVAR